MFNFEVDFLAILDFVSFWLLQQLKLYKLRKKNNNNDFIRGNKKKRRNKKLLDSGIGIIRVIERRDPLST